MGTTRSWGWRSRGCVRRSCSSYQDGSLRGVGRRRQTQCMCRFLVAFRFSRHAQPNHRLGCFVPWGFCSQHLRVADLQRRKCGNTGDALILYFVRFLSSRVISDDVSELEILRLSTLAKFVEAVLDERRCVREAQRGVHIARPRSVAYGRIIYARHGRMPLLRHFAKRGCLRSTASSSNLMRRPSLAPSMDCR